MGVSQSGGGDLPARNNELESARLGVFAALGSPQALTILKGQLRNPGLFEQRLDPTCGEGEVEELIE